MGAADQIEIELVQEVGHHVLVERVADATLVRTPALLLVALGIGPQQIAHQTYVFLRADTPTLVGDLARPLDGSNVVEGGNLGGEAAVHAQDPSSHQCAQREVFEALLKSKVEKWTISADAPVAEAVELVHGVGLVVSAQQEDAVGVFHFVGEEEAQYFDAVLSPVHVVSTRENKNRKATPRRDNRTRGENRSL